MINFEVIKGIPSDLILQEIAKLDDLCFANNQYSFQRLKDEFQTKANLITIMSSEDNEYIAFNQKLLSLNGIGFVASKEN